LFLAYGEVMKGVILFLSSNILIKQNDVQKLNQRAQKTTHA
jgi:hypothetical protein